jgi:mutator protein MutT
VVAGALVRRGQFLACKRPADADQGGLWELPGGKVEADESDSEALERELAEELGINVVVGPLLAENLHPYPEVEVLLVAYLCSCSDEPEMREHAEFRWLDADTAFGVEWAPADVPLIRALRDVLPPQRV